MRIGIDARFYSEAGGLGRYTQELLKELEKQNTSDFFIIFVNQDGWKDYQPQNPKFHKVLANIKWYTMPEQLRLGQIIKNQKVDLMHFLHWNIPFFYHQPFIVTIHDLILLKYPSRQASTLGPIKYWLKNLGYKLILHHAIIASKKILVPSQFVKKDIVANFPITPEKIDVTYEGITTFPDNSLKPEILSQLKITKPYFLYVGVSYPHKNLEKLVLAWEEFQKKYSPNYQLVLVGKKNYFYQRLDKFIQKNKITDVILTDFILDQDLPTLYQKATAFVFPSLYEGFGLPPLEALAFNLPVISSNTSCLPEILGPAALYFNPTSTTDIAKALNHLISDPNLHLQLVSLGQERIKLFSWQNCAQLTLLAYLK